MGFDVVCAGGLSVATWNARAFFAQCTATRQKRRQYFKDVLNKFDVVMLQETHGSDDSLRILAPELASGREVHYSMGGLAGDRRSHDTYSYFCLCAWCALYIYCRRCRPRSLIACHSGWTSGLTAQCPQLRHRCRRAAQRRSLDHASCRGDSCRPSPLRSFCCW